MFRGWIGLVLGLLLGAANAETPKILILGDSLSAAYGIAQSDGWVALLQTRLNADGFPHRLINASISGETTRGGLTRLPKLLAEHRPAVVVIALGSNDGLRGTPMDVMRAQIDGMIEQSRDAGARVLLIGNRLPPNYGEPYSDAFQAVFIELARDHQLPLVPFMLADIATDDRLLQADRLHPTAAAEPILRDRIGDAIEALLRSP
ncbi:MAG: arylesterase [Gammaproteobacteria bacterium]|nr:arylesterase [Gammaproteobacteria bacterium]MCP5136294.1 arylesterase [Gammaproteobacteria bacterium]